MNMPRVTVGFGIILILVGFLGAYLAVQDGGKAATALIPSYFGAAMTVLGMLALKENLRMHMMHGAVLVAAIGFLIPGFMVIKTALAGEIARPLAFAMQGIMAVTCGGFVVLAVSSFVKARKARAAAEAA